jgi:predicted nucleic acid-binding protein
MARGLTLDTGALIALEARRQRIRQRLKLANDERRLITVPAAVVTEWWRGRTDLRDDILAGVRVELLTASLAKIAGEALAAVAGPSAVDAIVMASAAQRGDIVYTSDVPDLLKLARHFPGVRVLRA